MKKRDLIQAEFQENGSYVIELKQGWHNGSDPLAPEHLIFEDTKRAAYARLARVVRCHCEFCE